MKPIILFPNPTSSTTLLAHHQAAEMGEVTIKLYSANGTLLKQQHEHTITGQQTFSLDITALPPGSYLLEMNNGKRRGITKFVVQ